MDTTSKIKLGGAGIGCLGAVIVGILGFFGTISVPFISHFFPPKPAAQEAKATNETQPAVHKVRQLPKKRAHTNVQEGDDNFLNDQENRDGQQVGPITGSNNQVVQNTGTIGTVNLAPASPHPVTSGDDLAWTEDAFAEATRSGNLPAIKEYLTLKDGFDPNTINGHTFVLQLPIFEGKKNFPEILGLFKATGRLNWTTQNSDSIWVTVYGHPVSLQWSLLQEAAANKNDARAVKALIDAGADPAEFVADEIKMFNAPAHGALIYQGALTGRTRDSSGATAEQALAIFKNLGYPLPNLQQATAGAAKTGAACQQEVMAHHTLKEAMDLANRPPQAPPGGQSMTWDPFQQAVLPTCARP